MLRKGVSSVWKCWIEWHRLIELSTRHQVSGLHPNTHHHHHHQYIHTTLTAQSWVLRLRLYEGNFEYLSLVSNPKLKINFQKKKTISDIWRFKSEKIWINFMVFWILSVVSCAWQMAIYQQVYDVVSKQCCGYDRKPETFPVVL